MESVPEAAETLSLFVMHKNVRLQTAAVFPHIKRRDNLCSLNGWNMNKRLAERSHGKEI